MIAESHSRVAIGTLKALPEPIVFEEEK